MSGRRFEVVVVGGGQAGLAVGYWQDQQDIARNWAIDRKFEPQLAASVRESLYHDWQRAVERSRAWAE